MMSAILCLSAAAIILLINIATSESLGKGPAHLVNIAEGQATRGNFQNALNFLDLASNYSEPFVALPLLGSVRPTDHLIYVNVD